MIFSKFSILNLNFEKIKFIKNINFGFCSIGQLKKKRQPKCLKLSQKRTTPIIFKKFILLVH
jgi:hypothetical protein